ncbi:MAG: glycogen phosphorylase [Chlamydia sp. 32-24]|nr:MAG: glycogen phosphorylase [Chlamydia sp. 32-24]
MQAPDLDISMNDKIAMLVAKIKHYLITSMGKMVEDANNDEIYRALSYALREEIVINWLASFRTFQKKDIRQLYYISMEYLPGRLLINNITNLQATTLVQQALLRLNRSYNDILNSEGDPGLGNGGLGRLASCFLDSLATKHYPAKAYGLRYQYGIFEQHLAEGIQIEAPDRWLMNENPWEFRRDFYKVFVKYCGKVEMAKNIHGDEIFNLHNCEEVQALPFDYPIIGYSEDSRYTVLTLRLWSTKESPRNFQLQRFNAGRLDQAAENTTLTDVLYPNDYHETGKRIRLKQEYLLVSSSLQDIIRQYLSNHKNFRAFSDKVRIQINDTHPSLVIPELIRILNKHYDIPWKMAVEITQACTGYTNHTILNEALEQWDKSLMEYLLPRQYKIIEKLNQDFCNKVRQKFPNDESRIQRLSIISGNMVRMAHLAIVGSHKVNGVAELHSEILKNKVFKDFYELDPEKFINITNGVTPRRWLLECNPELAKFLNNRIGNGWITDFTQIKKIADFAKDPLTIEEFSLIKKRNKQRLAHFMKKNVFERNFLGEITRDSPIIDLDSLFDVQVKRIHEYKRQLMNILHVIMLYQEMLSNPHHTRIKRTCIFGGKAAAGYEMAKEIIRLIYCVGRKINHDPRINHMLKVVYIDNYNVSKAELIIPATDLSEQISTAGMEASGTSNMKFAMNGALTIGTEDGANIEMRKAIKDEWWPFSFGATAEKISEVKDSYNPLDIYNNNPKIRAALDSLKASGEDSFANYPDEERAFNDLFYRLTSDHGNEKADRYFTLYDLQNYFDVQKKVEELYLDPIRWAEIAIHNIAGMGNFSTDTSIENYSKLVWNLEPCPTDIDILERVSHDYKAHDRRRIY